MTELSTNQKNSLGKLQRNTALLYKNSSDHDGRIFSSICAASQPIAKAPNLKELIGKYGKNWGEFVFLCHTAFIAVEEAYFDKAISAHTESSLVNNFKEIKKIPLFQTFMKKFPFLKVFTLNKIESVKKIFTRQDIRNQLIEFIGYSVAFARKYGLL